MRYEKWEYNTSNIVVRIKLINYHDQLMHYIRCCGGNKQVESNCCCRIKSTKGILLIDGLRGYKLTVLSERLRNPKAKE